jgi:excisionase family DNA binding protein
MARTTKAQTKPKAGANAMPEGQPPATGEVLTLAEAAAYLRLPEAEVVRLVNSQGLPGRRAGEEWRFLKAAVQDWLRTPAPQPGKEAMLSRIGSWKDDPHLEEMLREIFKRRGRPMTEDGE